MLEINKNLVKLGLFFFSRRFMKWNETSIVAFLFFQSTRTDQNSSTKVLQNISAPKCTIWSSELNQKCFSCFPAKHTIPGEIKGSPLSVFSGTVKFVSENETFSPLQFFDVLRQNPFNCDKNVVNFGRVPFQRARGSR